MLRAAAGVCALALTLVSSACGAPVDLKKTLQVSQLTGGWFDAGFVEGRNKLIPSVTFRLRKSTDASLRPLSINVVFKRLPAPGSSAIGRRLGRSVPAERHVRRHRDAAVDSPSEPRLHRRSAPVARRHAPEQPVPRYSRAPVREAQLVAVGGGRAGRHSTSVAHAVAHHRGASCPLPQQRDLPVSDPRSSGASARSMQPRSSSRTS